MIATEDFTSMTPGTLVVLEGWVKECPLCGRSGVEHLENAAPYYVHSQSTQMLCDGLRVEPDDVCLTPLV